MSLRNAQIWSSLPLLGTRLRLGSRPRSPFLLYPGIFLFFCLAVQASGFRTRLSCSSLMLAPLWIPIHTHLLPTISTQDPDRYSTSPQILYTRRASQRPDPSQTPSLSRVRQKTRRERLFLSLSLSLLSVDPLGSPQPRAIPKKDELFPLGKSSERKPIPPGKRSPCAGACSPPPTYPAAGAPRCSSKKTACGALPVSPSRHPNETLGLQMFHQGPLLPRPERF